MPYSLKFLVRVKNPTELLAQAEELKMHVQADFATGMISEESFQNQLHIISQIMADVRAEISRRN